MMSAALSRLIRFAAVTLPAGAAASLSPGLSAAAPAGKAEATQAAVGTFPLLAALGIGIAVAVGAVIAFLQLTSKGRQLHEASDWHEPDGDDHPFRHDEFGGHPDDGGDEESNPDDRVSDYTIPLIGVAAEPASSDETADGEPRVYGVGGEFSGTTFRLDGSGLSIGRDPALCQVVFPVEIGEVSRRHCTLSFEKKSRMFLLEDHGSSNGTFLPDGERLQPGKRYQLKSGERFALSGALHWFEVRE